MIKIAGYSFNKNFVIGIGPLMIKTLTSYGDKQCLFTVFLTNYSFEIKSDLLEGLQDENERKKKAKEFMETYVEAAKQVAVIIS